MNADQVFSLVKNAADNEKWEVSDAAMEEYSGEDWDILRQSLDEFIMSNSLFNIGE